MPHTYPLAFYCVDTNFVTADPDFDRILDAVCGSSAWKDVDSKAQQA